MKHTHIDIPNPHEWIPSNLIIDVIDRAAHVAEFLEGVKWIDLQNELRSNTSWIIFKPYPPRAKRVSYRDQGDHTVFQGHYGAVYLESGQGDEIERTKQTTNEDAFHQACRRAFEHEDVRWIVQYLTNLQRVFEEWVWNDEEPLQPLHPKMYTKKSGGLNIAAHLDSVKPAQRGYYQAIQSKFAALRGKYSNGG